MKVLVDVNISPESATTINAAGIEAIHWSSVGESNEPDAEIMAYADREQYVILTHELDFGIILSATRQRRPSIVQLRVKQASPALIGQIVVDVLRQTAERLEQGAIVTIDLKRTRLSLLPLRRNDDDWPM